MKKQTIAIVASTLLLASGVSFGQATGSDPDLTGENVGGAAKPVETSPSSGTPPAGGLTKGKMAVIAAAAAGAGAALNQGGSGGGNTGTTGTTGTN